MLSLSAKMNIFAQNYGKNTEKTYIYQQKVVALHLEKA